MRPSAFGDPCRAAASPTNQFRLLLHTAAYVLMFKLRGTMAETELANVQMDTLRIKLLKIGAEIRVTARRIWIRISHSHPSARLFESLAIILGARAPA